MSWASEDRRRASQLRSEEGLPSDAQNSRREDPTPATSIWRCATASMMAAGGLVARVIAVNHVAVDIIDDPATRDGMRRRGVHRIVADHLHADLETSSTAGRRASNARGRRPHG